MPSNGFYFSSHNGRHHIIRWDDGTMGNRNAKYFSKYRVSIKAIIVERLVSIHVYALLHFANNFPVVMLQCCRVLRFGFVWSGSYLSTSAAYSEYTFIAMMVTKEKYESNIDEDDEEEKTKLLKVAFLPPLPNEICELIDSSPLLFRILWEAFFEALLLIQIKVNRIESDEYCYSCHWWRRWWCWLFLYVSTLPPSLTYYKIYAHALPVSSVAYTWCDRHSGRMETTKLVTSSDCLCILFIQFICNV